MGIRGIYLFNGTGHKVFNNLITDINLTSGDFTGIEIRTGGTAPQISFNTIILDNSIAGNGDLAGIAEELSNTNSQLRNNLISITQGGSGIRAGLMLGAVSSVTTALNSNHNLIWVPSGNVAVKGGTTPVNYASLAAWQGASNQDMQSLAIDPMTSNAIPANPAADNAGISIPGIVSDITGAPRAFIPDIGAYEFLTTGLNGTISFANVHVYPNPAKNMVFIDLPFELSRVEAITLDGKVIELEFYLQGSKNVIHTAELAAGFYQLKIYSQSENYTAKIVVPD